MAEISNNDIYFALDKQVEQKFILSQNQQALIYARDLAIAEYTRAMVTIPSALVNLKWQNRRDIYPLRVKEEVYGAVIMEIISRYPELKSQIMVQLEANYQHIKAQEAQTLMLSRTLADGTCKTATVKPGAAAPAATPAITPQAVAPQPVAPAEPVAPVPGAADLPALETPPPAPPLQAPWSATYSKPVTAPALIVPDAPPKS